MGHHTDPTVTHRIATATGMIPITTIMVIRSTGTLQHWNYFLALEHDLDVMSRYVEFCDDNLKVYSIELAHLLFAAASEVDVIAKLLCQRLEPDAPCSNIDDYRTVLRVALPELPERTVYLPRYGLDFRPWANWSDPTEHPDWWRSYNRVKHQRDRYFDQATLQHALNAMGALLILAYCHYSYALAPDGGRLMPKDTTDRLGFSSVLRLDNSYYRVFMTAG